jgi:hypothetical protein
VMLPAGHPVCQDWVSLGRGQLNAPDPVPSTGSKPPPVTTGPRGTAGKFSPWSTVDRRAGRGIGHPLRNDAGRGKMGPSDGRRNCNGSLSGWDRWFSIRFIKTYVESKL